MTAGTADPTLQVRLAREGAAWRRLPGIGLLRVSGLKPRAFLQGQVTADVAALAPGEGIMSCLTTPKGRMRARFAVLAREEDALLLAEKEALKAAAPPLAQAAPLADCELANVSADYEAAWATGPAAGMLVESAVGAVEGAASWACPYGGADGFVLLAPAGRLAAALDAMAAAGKDGACELGDEAAEVLRVEGGAPKFGVDYDEAHFPLELGLDADVAFAKGCFLGQETLAHIKNRGHLNRRLMGVKVRGPLKAGWSLLAAGEPVGKITSAVFSPELAAGLGLCVVAASHMEPGSRVTVTGGGGSREAEIVSLPVRA